MKYTRKVEAKVATFLAKHSQVSAMDGYNIPIWGKSSSEIPKCMSRVIATWIMHIEDRSPTDSLAWKAMLLKAYGTGRKYELERATMIMSWLLTIDNEKDLHKLDMAFALLEEARRASGLKKCGKRAVKRLIGHASARAARFMAETVKGNFDPIPLLNHLIKRF